MNEFLKTNKKKIAAICAIALAVALVAASVVALVITNASSNTTNSQSDEVSDIASGTSTSTTSAENAAENTAAEGEETKAQETATADAAPENGQTENENATLSNEGSHADTSGSNEGSHGGSASSGTTSTENPLMSDTTNSSENSNSAMRNADDAHVKVHITIDANGHGNVSYAGDVTLDEGASVYDALKATGTSVNARDTQYGTYVNAIGGVAEKSAGGESGWKYAVNGTTPNTACSNYKLKSGDVVKWKFTTSINEAVG